MKSSTRSFRAFFAAALSGLLMGPFSPPQASTGAVVEGEPVPLHHISALECKECHNAIYEQWSNSMHAKSTAFNDPIHNAFYRKVVGDPAKEGVKHKASGKYPVCLQCHAPNAAQDGKTKLDAMPAYTEGVNCVTCHRFKKYKGTQGEDGKLRLGLKAYEVSEFIQGPSGFLYKPPEQAAAEAEDNKPNPHVGMVNAKLGKELKPFVNEWSDEPFDVPVESNPGVLKTSAACLGCHDQRNNPHGVPLCQTGNEYVQGKSYVTCQSCHMPISGGFADHTIGGGHDLGMLRRAVVFSVDVKENGEKLDVDVSLHNQQPHSMPTGAPFRNVVLRLTAYDVDGKQVWENFKEHPGKEDPKAYLVYELADEKGNPASPPVAKKLGKNTRLAPYEKRYVQYEIPSDGVALVRGELYYNLLWPSLVKKLDKVLPEDLKKAQLISWSEVRL